jgi:fatty acid desaturase
MFREAEAEGKPGPVSMRRVLAFLLAVSAIGLFVGGFFFAVHGWVVFIPGCSALAGALLLLFFTTWADVQGIVAAWKGKGA